MRVCSPPEGRRVAGFVKGSEGFSSIPLPRAASTSTPASTQLSRNRERLLWAAHVRAVELDLSERTPESRILRRLAHVAWRDVFLADGAAP